VPRKVSSHHSATPVAMLGGLFRQRELLWELVKRDFIGRYKGSMLGVIWSLLNPLLMLAIYTVVFSVAFKARWRTDEEIVIDVRNLSMRYEIYNTPRDRLKQLFLTNVGFRKISRLFCEIIFYPYFEISGKLQKECV
jgi:hypothetical protein